MRSDGRDGRSQIVHLEEEQGLIAGGIGLRTFCFQTHERSVRSELGMVTGLLVRDVKAQRVEVRLPGALQVFKIELYATSRAEISLISLLAVSDRTPAAKPCQSIWNEGPLTVAETSSRRFATARAT